MPSDPPGSRLSDVPPAGLKTLNLRSRSWVLHAYTVSELKTSDRLPETKIDPSYVQGQVKLGFSFITVCLGLPQHLGFGGEGVGFSVLGPRVSEFQVRGVLRVPAFPKCTSQQSEVLGNCFWVLGFQQAQEAA